MSQPPSQSQNPNFLARLKYEAVFRDLPTLRNSVSRISDKTTALSWAEVFGDFMVRRSFSYRFLTRLLIGFLA
jgi:hypothetical protein